MVNSFIFVSALYANPKSSGDYVRFKGLVEEELKQLNFPKLGIMRPSFLMGDRKEKRVGEKIGIFVFKLLSPLLLGPLKKMRPIHSETVAKAMIRAANKNLENINCYSNEGDKWEKSKTNILNNTLTIQFRTVFKPRRGRINCSLNDNGKWRWFGVQFPIKEN